MVLGKLFKFHPTFIQALAQILMQLSGNMYIVVVTESNYHWNEIFYEKIRREVIQELNDDKYLNSSASSDEKVLKTLSRLIFMHYDHYYVVLKNAQVTLDTFPYGGCLTSHDSLSQTVPMVTLPLEHVR